MTYRSESILILDFGGQYSQQLARQIRSLGVYSEICPYNISANELQRRAPQGIILSGDLSQDEEAKERTCDPAIFKLPIPKLGIGYGTKVIANSFEAQVEATDQQEYRMVEINVRDNHPLFSGLPTSFSQWMNPSLNVLELPVGFEVDARTPTSIAAFSNLPQQIFALQFHPEADPHETGREILHRFLFKVCGCKGKWNAQAFIDDAVDEIRKTVGDKKVLCALSGGVDSSVVAVLIHRAIGDQLTCVFVDHGLLRKGEAESVMNTFADHFQMTVIKVDAAERFLKKLKGITDPEQKRKIIGNEFIHVFEEEASRLKDHHFLGQGTLYTDILESGTMTSKKIKSHHNVGGLPDEMKMELLEPLRTLFKDEVRLVGEALGLPEEIVWRQPFPGPGLAIRVIGEVTPEKIRIVRDSDAILREEIRLAGLDREIWQYFTTLPDFKSVGVTGDARTYAYTVGIRAVTSVDGTRATWARIPYEVLDRIVERIISEVGHVNRVVYDITSKPPATIEWE